MIIEETLEFEFDENENPLEVSKIEKFIQSKGINPVRFSLISMEKNKMKLGVSGVREQASK